MYLVTGVQTCALPICSLITGANNTRHRVTNWTLEKNKATDRPSNTIELPDWNYKIGRASCRERV